MERKKEALGIPESNTTPITNIEKNLEIRNTRDPMAIVNLVTREIKAAESQTLKEEGWKSTVVPWDLEIMEPEPLVLLGGELILSRENITVITGGKKSLKSTILSTIVAACISGRAILNVETPEPLKVLLCDTEQGLPHIGKQRSRMIRMGNLSEKEKSNCIMLNLRPFSTDARRKYIFDAAREWRPDLICIDGAADLLADTNDLAESEAIVASMLTLTSELNCGILTIVHSVPGGTKTRGHLGSTLERKSESIIFLDRDEMSECVTVKEQAARNKPFKTFSLEVGEYGDLRLQTVQDGPRTAEDWLIYLMKPEKEYQHKDLVMMLAEKGFSKTTVTDAIRKILPSGRIVKTDNKYSITLHPDEVLFSKNMT